MKKFKLEWREQISEDVVLDMVGAAQAILSNLVSKYESMDIPLEDIGDDTIAVQAIRIIRTYMRSENTHLKIERDAQAAKERKFLDETLGNDWMWMYVYADFIRVFYEDGSRKFIEITKEWYGVLVDLYTQIR